MTTGIGSRTLRIGLRGEDVAELQRLIGATPVDGVFGARTQGAVAAFQAGQGLVADGVAGPATLRRLRIRDVSARPVFVAPPTAIGAEELQSAIGRAAAQERCADPAGWAPVLAAAMRKWDITSPLRATNFAANIIHETRLSRLVESLTYTTPERLMENWPSRFPTVESARPFLRNGPALAERVYGGRFGNDQPGDGWRWRGRGLIQVTFRSNYEALATLLGRPADELAAAMETREGAAETAAAWWSMSGVNEIADRGSAEAVRRRVNGGRIGLEDTLAIYERIEKIFV